jgi:hypothetical protein
VVTLLVYALLAIVAVGALYGLALLFLAQEQISPAARDEAPWAISDDQLDPSDIVGVRLPVAVRGYRFAETDLLLDRLTEELRLRDEEISRLRARTAAHSDSAAAAPPIAAIGSTPPPPLLAEDTDPPFDRAW